MLIDRHAWVLVWVLGAGCTDLATAPRLLDAAAPDLPDLSDVARDVPAGDTGLPPALDVALDSNDATGLPDLGMDHPDVPPTRDTGMVVGRDVPADTGEIVCGAGLTACLSGCADLSADPANCGACGSTCVLGTPCSDGLCGGVPAPPNDARATATRIDTSVPATALATDTTGAFNDTTGTCACTSGRDVFYVFTLTRAELVYADTLDGGTWSTALFFQDAAGGNVTAAGVPEGQACAGDSGLRDCVTGGRSQVLALLEAGTYYLVLSGCGSGPAMIRFQHLPMGSGGLTWLGTVGTFVISGATTGSAGFVSTTCCTDGPEVTYYWYGCPGYLGGAFLASTCATTWMSVLEQLSAGRTESAYCSAANAGCTVRGMGSYLSTPIPPGPGLHALYVDGCHASGAFTLNYTRP